MSKDLIIYVDFDLTLFNTVTFRDDLWELIAQEALVTARQVSEDAPQFFEDLNLGGYDFAAHVRSYGLNEILLWQRLDDLLAKKDYLYFDSCEFIQSLEKAGYRPQILSFGETRFQTSKIQPTLTRLTGDSSHELLFEVVFRKKREHIIKLHPGKHGVLVDDKPGQELPDGFVEITLDRTMKIPGPLKTKVGWITSDLRQTLEVILSLSL